ncbi:type II toxin-antitoxin system VapC family toxin [Achromobacter sp. GG226]|uniref:type II toxin-antitoxin system VapC family toxin n=1 Tax=Verticiella alkaliphila TaxID=2779529 RepID=UPI001C0D886D|nr:type II toxin-antitoxin system VapC family toxin [Verticiella sp. GG226]MBU4610838.1 type II toxin-antitoxin system VapC family toxin [Verticiella sp. GG226]
MTITTLSGRELNQDVTRAKKATKDGPVFITDRGKPAHVTAWAQSVDAADLFISAITVMELELGVLSIERKDATQGALLRAWLEQHVLPEFADRTLPVALPPVAQRCARLRVRDKRGERDALIAATALVHGMTVVTRNVDDVKPTKVAIVNPWSLSP